MKPDLLLVAELPPAERAKLSEGFTVHDLWQQPDAERFMQEHGRLIRAVATRGDTGIDAALMDAMPGLEIVSVYGVGYDAVDTDLARKRGIRVTNTPDVLTDDVADMAMALLLATTRRIVEGDRHVRSGAWAAGPMPLTRSLRGKRMGIVGLGRVGAAVATRATAFGVEVLYTGRGPRDGISYGWRANALALARDVDFLVICAAANAETAGMIDRTVIEALGPAGILVNVSRGSLVDERALIEALEQRRLLGAGLDVFSSEPVIDPRFATLGNVVLQPHNGSGTTETRAAIGDLMRENLTAHFAGRPLPTPVV